METITPEANEAEIIAETLEKHFDRRAALYGTSVEAVDWKSSEAQYNRFRQLLKVVDRAAPFSINDYGCGNGEIVNFLKTTDFEFEYFGFDLSPVMIEKAKESFAGLSNCRFSTDIKDLPAADYTVASGVFNLKFGVSDARWTEYMKEKVSEINRFSRCGFAFNALTAYSDIEFRRDDLYYADPLFWFDYCKKNLSPFVSLLHDYPEYDFTIIVRK